MTTNAVTATMREALAEPGRDVVLRRLHDWRHRVHAMYESVQANLHEPYACDRSGKQRSQEGQVQRAGLTEDDIPAIDILRITRNGHVVAQFIPRMLWLIGANGRVDLLITTPHAGRLFMLFDRSSPFANQSDWRLVRPTDPMARPPFHPELLHELLE
jgi:hypothetical protein